MQKGVKPITFASFAGAVLVIAGTGWASKDWFLERWLVYRLRSTDIAVKVSAIEGLGRLGRCAAVPEIVEAGLWAKALWEPARKALLAMGLRAKPWLLEALKSQDPKARLLAAKALLEMPREGESPMPLLLWMLAEGDGAERLKSVEELGKRKSLPAEDAARAAPLMVDYVLRDGSAGAEEALVRFGAPAVMPLVQALTGPYYGCRSADLLGRIGPDAGPGVPVVVGILKALLLQAPERTEA